MSDDPSELERKLAYYRKRLDDSAGRIVQADYRIASLKHALEQRRQGFALLAEFQQTVSTLSRRDEVVRAVAGALINSLGMNRSVVYAPADGAWTPTVALGFEHDAPVDALPAGLTDAPRALLFTKATAPDEPGAVLLRALGVKSCVCVPLRDDGVVVNVLVTGRVKEMPPLYPPLDEGDVETMTAIAASVSAALQTRRVALLRELDQLRMDFFANISHEFRTPITLTLAPIEAMLSGRAGALPEAAVEPLRLMQRNQRKLLDLVNQILDLARIEAGQATLQTSMLGDAPALVRSIAGGFDALARNRGLALTVSGDAQPVDVAVALDVEMFERALTNVLANALKFTAAGEVSVRWAFTATHFRVAVQDSGIGIDAADLPFVFDRFRRSSTAKRHAGTGIGLALVKEIVTLHGGAVEVRSRRGEGTIFELAFPTSEATAGRTSLWSTPRTDGATAPVLVEARGGDDIPAWNLRAAQTAHTSRASVLYVDDNPDLRRHVGELLAEEFNTWLAGDGEEALGQLRVRAFDLVLSDVMMPRVDGVELCRAVRGDPAMRHIPFVLLTAKTGEADRLAALDLGADDYLGKPFTHAELLARVRNLLRMRALQLQTERDIHVARSIQHAVLPGPRVQGASVTVEHLFEPCDALSGDFCDVLTLGEDTVAYVADVTSHGIAAAQVTYLVREAFRRNAREGCALSALLAAVARDYQQYGLAFDVAVHAAQVRGARLSLCRAGAPLAVHVRGDVATVLTAPPSPSLGQAASEDALRAVELALAPGDQVFVFTDGAPELMVAGRALGMRRLRDRLLAASRDDDWRAGLSRMFEAARRAGELRDDITVLRLRA